MTGAITPAEYFCDRDYDARAAHSFCAGFPTMREAWLDDGCRVAWMLHFLGSDKANIAGLVAFARFCADSAVSGVPESGRARVAARRASEATHARVAAYMASVAADSAAYAAFQAVSRELARAATAHSAMIAAENAAVATACNAQRDELRRLFPDQFK